MESNIKKSNSSNTSCINPYLIYANSKGVTISLSGKCQFRSENGKVNMSEKTNLHFSWMQLPGKSGMRLHDNTVELTFSYQKNMTITGRPVHEYSGW